MPKFIGRSIEGAAHVDDNATSRSTGLVRLTYAQAKLLSPNRVSCSLDTTDLGSKQTKAKRWYRWFASVRVILSSTKSTPNMRARAQAFLSAQDKRAA